jgi:beta-lactamase regulating signal transducer with metallopeptidase domain
MSLNTKSIGFIILILALVALAGCGGEKTAPPNYSATSTAAAYYYQTQAAESIARATTSAGGETPSSGGTFPFASCIIALFVVGAIIFLFVQSRRRRKHG